MIVYLACPYSSRMPWVREARYEQANRAAAWAMSQGHTVFSPISHSHPICGHLDEGMLLSHDFWMSQDLPLLRKADALWVLCIAGWDTSRGVAREIQEAEANGIPIRYVQPDAVR